MKKIYLTLFISFSVIFSVQANESLKVIPNKVLQGDQAFVEYISNDDVFYDKLFVKLSDELKTPLLRIEKNKYRAYLPIPTDSKSGGRKIEVIDSNDDLLFEKSFIVLNKKFYKQYINISKPKLTKYEQEKIDSEEKMIKSALNTVSPKQLWKGPFIKPVTHRVSSVYGVKRFFNGKPYNYHTGIDFASPYGYPVKATNNAKVIFAKYLSKKNSNGNLVILDHGHGVTSAYLHLSKISTKEGAFIKKGETLGYIGSTGRSTGPHLHWGFYLNGKNTNGLNWLKLSKYLFKD